MEHLDESFSPGREAAGNQRQTPHNERVVLDDGWKPCLRARGRVNGCLQKLTSVLGAWPGAWLGFMALGLLTAVISFLMDLTVTKILAGHRWLYTRLEGHTALQFLAWTLCPSSLCAIAASFSQHICPHATGSGLPEVRALLAGVDMPHYLSPTNLGVKLLGLTCTLGAGSTLFLGKVGPFVHLSTMVGAYLEKISCIGHNNKRSAGGGETLTRGGGEVLVVAAAAGVASCFGAPVSGVLFSMEVMSSTFPLRHYVPCFFSATCGATTFSLLAIWSGSRETLEPLFKTHFPDSPAFCPQEMLVFAVLGLGCGLVSCIYLSLHRWVLRLTKTNRVLVHVLKTERVLYSAGLAFFLASLTFPHSVGRYMASTYTMKQLLSSLLDESEWGGRGDNSSVVAPPTLWSEWSPPGCSVFTSLSCFLLMKLWMLVLVTTLPIPAGYVMPMFIYGAAIGRLVGEGVAYLSPHQNPADPASTPVTPGGYALAGAAAFSGAATHTLSPALLALELSGQLSHAAPVLLATLLANGVARWGRRPSFYDNISLSKRLPHLQPLLRASPGLSSAPIGDFLGPVGAVLERGAGPTEVRRVVDGSSHADIPVVDSMDSRILLGSLHRADLLEFLRQQKDQVKDMAARVGDVCHVHPTSAQLSPSTTIQEAHAVLNLLPTHTLFVTHEGKLVGLITRAEMKRILEEAAVGEI